MERHALESLESPSPALFAPPPTPTELRNDRQARVLYISWDDGAQQQLPHALLRSVCKCTVCQSQRLQAGAVDVATGLAARQSNADSVVTDLRQVGLYGVQLVFDDGHERGIYPWAYLRTLSPSLASCVTLPA